MKIKLYDVESEVTPIAPKLWSVKNCFDKDTFTKLSTVHLNYVDKWHRHHDCLEYRLQLTPESPTMDKLNEIAREIKPAIEQIVGRSLEIAQTKMWLDLSDWHCPYHSDAELLLVTYQVYLWCHGDVHGTEFCHIDPVISLKFEANNGYISLNDDLKIHHANRITGTRLSCCFQYRPEMQI